MEKIEIILSQVEYRLIYVYTNTNRRYIEVLIDNEIEEYRSKTSIGLFEFRSLMADRLLERIKSIKQRICYKGNGDIRVYVESHNGPLWYDWVGDEIKDFDIGSITCSVCADFKCEYIDGNGGVMWNTEQIDVSYRTLLAIAEILYEKNKAEAEDMLVLHKPQQTKEIVIKHPESTSPTIMSMLTTQSNKEAEQIVGRIKEIISTNITPKNIAIILVALEQMGHISLSNISLLSRVWNKEFGYRAAQKSLETGLSNHISGDHTKFERDNKSDIEQRKKQLQCNIVGNI